MACSRFRCLLLSSLACLACLPIGCQLTAPESLTGILGDEDSSSWPSMGEVSHWVPPVTSLTYSPDGKQLAVDNVLSLQGFYDDSRSSPLFSASVYSLWVSDNAELSETFYKRNGYRLLGGSQLKVTMSRDGAAFAAIHNNGMESNSMTLSTER